MRDRTTYKVKLVLLRHGETASNREGRYVGCRTDEPLSEAGCRQLADKKSLFRSAGRRQQVLEKPENKELRFEMPELLFVSPMRRCVETAGILFPGKEPVPVSAWKEMDFGLFEGKNYEELKEDPAYQSWLDSGGTAPFPEGENRQQFSRRVRKGWQDVWKEILAFLRERPGKGEALPVICLVVHGGIIMELCSFLAGGNYFDYQVPNCGGYSLVLTGSEKEQKVSELKNIWK